MYPGFAKTAREEGHAEIAEWFETLAKAEKSHAGRFQKGLELAEVASAREGAGRAPAPVAFRELAMDRSRLRPSTTRVLVSRQLDGELRRVFQICNGCRLCYNLCPSFPALLNRIDELDPSAKTPRASSSARRADGGSTRPPRRSRG